MNEGYDGSTALKNARHERFCHEYVIDYNASRSARAAGYAESGAGTEGYKLLKNPYVLARKNYLEKRAVDALGITKERITKELAAIAFANPDDVIEWGDTQMIEVEEDGKKMRIPYHGITIKNSQNLPAHVRAAIKKVKQGKDGLEVELHDKQAALRLLAAQAGIVTDNTKSAAELEIKSAPTVNITLTKAD